MQEVLNQHAFTTGNDMNYSMENGQLYSYNLDGKYAVKL